MVIAHTAIYTQDPERLADFYCRWFGGRAGREYENPARGVSSRFIDFGPGARLELMNSRNLEETVRREFTAGYAHLAFSTESAGEVERLTARLREAGYTVVRGPRTTGGGFFESCVLDPDGNRVEISFG